MRILAHRRINTFLFIAASSMLIALVFDTLVMGHAGPITWLVGLMVFFALEYASYLLAAYSRPM